MVVTGFLPLRAGPGGVPAWADRGRDPQQPSRHPHDTGPAGDGMPARFVAELDGRIVVVSADTGRIERRLTADQPGGGASDPAASLDGRTVWFSRGDGSCSAHIASSAVAGGPEHKLPGSGEAGPELVPLPRPGRDQLAYARLSCSDQSVTLIVGDLRGLEGHGQLGFVPLAWSRDGAHLLATSFARDELRVFDVNRAGAIVADQVVNPRDPAPGCTLRILGFSPDDNSGYVAVRRCGSSGDGARRRSLVVLDKDGVLRQTVLRLPRGQDFGATLAFDASGHALLYSTAPAGSSGARASEDTLWSWRDGDVRLLARQSRYRNASWLP
jgi:hypothetical protein